MLFSNLTRKLNPNLVIKRFKRNPKVLKAWPNDWVPFVWNRPETVQGYFDTGDLVKLEQPDNNKPRPDARVSRRLRELDKEDPLKKLFSLEHTKRTQHLKSFVIEQTQKLGLIHSFDYTNSLEAKIINLTYTLRELQERINYTGGTDGRYNGPLRSKANGVHHRRYRYLCELKELHRDRYDRIVKTLDLEPKENLINVPFIRPFRKKQMRRLAIEYCIKLKEKKVEDFMQSLEKEKQDFEEYKIETMKWIEEEEKKLSL